MPNYSIGEFPQLVSLSFSGQNSMGCARNPWVY